MKMNKISVGFLVVTALAFIPKISVSDEKTAEVITLSKSNTLVLNSKVNGESTSQIIAQAKTLDTEMNSKHLAKFLSNKEPLYLFLNSPGGDVQSGLEMVEALNGIGRPVHTVTLFAASMAFQIAQQLGDRLILKNGVMMSHHAVGQIEGAFGGVHPSQMDSRYQLWLDRIKELDEQTVKRTKGKQTYESYVNQYDHEFWLTGTKSVQQGYSDRVVMVKCDSTLSGVTTKSIEFLGVVISYDVDNCPINTSPMNVRISQSKENNLTNEIQDKIKSEFLGQFQNKQKQVIPMVF